MGQLSFLALGFQSYFDSKCRTSPPRSADGDRYRRMILPAAPCYELIPFTGNYRLPRLRNGTVARGGGDRSRKQIKGLSPHPGIEPGSPSYRPSMLTTTPMGPVIFPCTGIYILGTLSQCTTSPPRSDGPISQDYPAGCAML